MRPVSKGPPPTEYSQYQDALDDLEDRIGLFCCYCEQPIQHEPEVEHVQPKSLEPDLERSWNNLLLGCSSCNRVKGKKPVNLDQVAMPDTDNTFRGFVFLEGGRIKVSPRWAALTAIGQSSPCRSYRSPWPWTPPARC